MKSKPGRFGKIVSDILQDRILIGNKFLSEWYDSNPYRIFEGNDDDRRGIIQKDVLVLKKSYFSKADVRPVIVVDGSCAAIRNNKTIYQYYVTVYFDENNKRTSESKTILKSILEKEYKRYATIIDLSQETLNTVLDSAVQYYAISNSQLDKKLSAQEIYYLAQNYLNYIF